MAQVDTYIESLDSGYDSMITNANQTMSKGQIQRINLARSFLKDVPIYLFDEPTSALDVNLAQKVMHEILCGLQGKTVICIIHDLDNLSIYDRVMVMKDGKIAGFAPHHDLLDACKEYQTLLREATFMNIEEEQQ